MFIIYCGNTSMKDIDFYLWFTYWFFLWLIMETKPLGMVYPLNKKNKSPNCWSDKRKLIILYVLKVFCYKKHL